MSGEEIKQESISSLNEDIKQERGEKEDLDWVARGKPETPDHGQLSGIGETPGEVDLQQFIGNAGCEKEPMTAFMFGDAIPHKISDQQAGMMVQALGWTLRKIKDRWEELNWDDAAIVTVIENQVMNIRLQQKQIGQGENNGKNIGD